MSPFDKYVKSGDFSLVYSRYKDFTFYKDQINFASNFLFIYRKLGEVRLFKIKRRYKFQECESI